ncbi:MAG: hemerythrin domain-containing protein [Armatimonadota bacterium]|nr:MAG: hemerythrin domain-containing protein [Armatimonadota bacterium]
MSKMSPIQDLTKEHQALLADMKDLQAAVRELDAGAALSWAEQARTLRDQFEMFQRAMSLHIRREEEGLFPDVQSMVAEQGGRGDALSQFFAEEGEEDIRAHASLRTRTQEMLSLVDQMAGSAGPEQQQLGRLRTLVNLTTGLLERHAEKENKLIFPMIARSLNDDQMEQVGSRMALLGSAADLVDSSEGDLGDLRDLNAGPD